MGAVLQGLVAHAEVGLVSFLRPSELRWGSQPPPGLSLFRTVLARQKRDLTLVGRLRNKARMVFRWGWHGQPLLAAKAFDARMVELLRTVSAEFRPQIVLLEFGVMAQYRDCFGGIPVVLTDHEQGLALPDRLGPAGVGLARDRRLWRRYVARWYPRMDLLQALNDEDAKALSERVGRPVEVRPPIVPIPAEPVHPEASSRDVLFLGDYSHPPNPEAATFLAREVLPRLRRALPDAGLVLAGPRAGADVRRLAELPGVRLVGYVPDVADAFRGARLLLAPLFSGGGSRIKVLTALAHGLPVVSNALGLRGLTATAPAVSLAESPDGLARAALALLASPDAAMAAGRAARAFAERELSPDTLARRQIERFTKLLAQHGK